MKPMNDNEFKDKLSKTIANTLNAFSSKETPKVKDKSDLALRDSDVKTTKVFSDLNKGQLKSLQKHYKKKPFLDGAKETHFLLNDEDEYIKVDRSFMLELISRRIDEV